MFLRRAVSGSLSEPSWSRDEAANYVRFKETDHPAERWPSGLRRTLGKRVYFNEYRGFESHSLRHFTAFIINHLYMRRCNMGNESREFHFLRHNPTWFCAFFGLNSRSAHSRQTSDFG